jgi:hypothetical protein
MEYDRSCQQVWHLQIEHQQRNSDGVFAVAEGFQVTGLFFNGPCLLFTAHFLSLQIRQAALLLYLPTSSSTAPNARSEASWAWVKPWSPVIVRRS